MASDKNSRADLFEFKRKTLGQASCKPWHLPRGRRWRPGREKAMKVELRICVSAVEVSTRVTERAAAAAWQEGRGLQHGKRRSRAPKKEV